MPDKNQRERRSSRDRHPLRFLGTLRALRAFEKRHLRVLKTLEDCDLLCEIGYHQELRKPLTLKQIFLAGIGSVATVQRRLRRLRRLGAIEQRRCPHDRRSREVTLSPSLVQAFGKCADLLAEGR